MEKRTSVPERCNRPAIGCVEANGYRFCLDHSPEIKFTGMSSSRAVDVIFFSARETGPCDYPMDGLGAARISKENS